MLNAGQHVTDINTIGIDRLLQKFFLDVRVRKHFETLKQFILLIYSVFQRPSR
jgi:hypothetical protein